MTTNSTSRGTSTIGTISAPVSKAMGDALIHRMAAGIHQGMHRSSVTLKGQYVINAGGEAGVVVSVDQGSFNRMMAVREINSQGDGRSSSESPTGVHNTLGR